MLVIYFRISFKVSIANANHNSHFSLMISKCLLIHHGKRNVGNALILLPRVLLQRGCASALSSPTPARPPACSIAGQGRQKDASPRPARGRAAASALSLGSDHAAHTRARSGQLRCGVSVGCIGVGKDLAGGSGGWGEGELPGDGAAEGGGDDDGTVPRPSKVERVRPQLELQARRNVRKMQRNIFEIAVHGHTRRGEQIHSGKQRMEGGKLTGKKKDRHLCSYI